MNKAGYTPVMLAALTAAESPDDLEVAQQLLKLGDVNACSRQVIYYMLALTHWFNVYQRICCVVRWVIVVKEVVFQAQ